MGYLNTSPDDEYNLQALTQGGNTTTQLPGASGFDGVVEETFKGLASAGGVLGGAIHSALTDTVADDATHALFAGIDTANAALKPVFGYNPIAPFLDQQSRASATAAAATIQQWAATGEDPRIAGTLGRTVYGAAKAFGILAGATPVVGPWGAAALYGGSDAKTNYEQHIAAGMDQDTAIGLAGIAGITAAAGAMVPIGGGNLLNRVVTSAIANQGLDVGGRAASWAVLSANGYKSQADQQKIFDGQSLTADIIMGAAFGAHAHLAEGGFAKPDVKPLDVSPADVDASAAVLAQNHFDHSAPGIPVDPATATLHVKVMSQALDDMANADTIKVSAEDAQALAEGTLHDPSHDMAPQILEAAHETIPQFSDAVDHIAEIQPPVRAAGEPIGQIPPNAEGKPSPVQFDDMTQYRLDQLTSRYGDLQVTDENGKVQSFSEVAKQMQQELQDSDAMGRAHEAAAACFISSCGAA